MLTRLCVDFSEHLLVTLFYSIFVMIDKYKVHTYLKNEIDKIRKTIAVSNDMAVLKK